MTAIQRWLRRVVFTLLVVAVGQTVGCGEPPNSDAPAQTPDEQTPEAVEETGEVRGILVSDGTPIGEVAHLFRDAVPGEDEEEVQSLLNAMENRPDSAGAFHWFDVPTGSYHLFTPSGGIIGEGFTVEGGDVVDLGVVEVGG